MKKKPVRKSAKRNLKNLLASPAPWDIGCTPEELAARIANKPTSESIEAKRDRLMAALRLSWSDLGYAIHELRAMGYRVDISERSVTNPWPDAKGKYQTNRLYEIDVFAVLEEGKAI